MDEASSGQASTQVAGPALRQAGAALGRMTGRAAAQAAKVVLRWALVTLGPWVALLLLAIVGLALILAVLHGPGGDEQVADIAAARAAVRGAVTVGSFDSEELQFLPSPTLVAVITWNLKLQGRQVSAQEVAAELRPTFEYTTLADETDIWLTPDHPGDQPVLAERLGSAAAKVVARVTTYQGSATLAYSDTQSTTECPQGSGKGTYCTQQQPKLQSVSWNWDDSRYLSLLAGWFPGQDPADAAEMLAFESERWDGTDVASLGMPLPAGKDLIANVRRWDPIFTIYATPAVPVALMEAITAQESGGDPGLTSPAGAEGLMQVEPGSGLRAADLYDPTANVAAGSALVQWLAGQYGMHPGCVAARGRDPDCQRALVLVLAAYNAGPGAVAKWGGVPPYKETIAYVRDVEGYLADFGAAGGG